MTTCTFDGPNKRIIVDSGVSNISVKDNIYTEWKDWVLAGNLQYPPALRAIGGDPIGGGQFAGDIYFLMNGWQIHTDHPINVSGVIYHDDAIEPFVISAGGSVRSTVSSLVQTVATAGGDNTAVLADLDMIKKMITDTQAFVLSQ